ncbi:hypothetical protein [Bacillus thuringiensis]|uniref:hypothetical protein n=1 Tax=Bacillus cereus group TaxID=86661 RepID=UPI00330EE6DE|nr:hypothetical protein [Bacillus cereus]MCU5270875.1 hypothetical protein [Bacillus cereus]MCU5606897.1 hypothetical protein [Bacillus cereus]HDR6390233.1 hypothetical protein [Bacillus cereus]
MYIYYLLLKRDIFLGISKMKLVFILLFIINLLLFLYPIYFFSVYMPNDLVSFWDVIGKSFGGIPIELIERKTFEFPFSWLLLQLCVATIIGNFIKDDLFSHSAFIRIRAKSIWALWMSKLVFCVILIGLFYFLLFGITWFICELNGQMVNHWTEYSKDLMVFTKIKLSYSQTILYSILLNFGGSVCITIVYATLSLIVRTIYSYLICVSILFSSVFSSNFIFIGNYTMLLRQPLFVESPLFSIYLSFVIQIVLSLIFIIIGGIYLSRIEIFTDHD